MPSRHCFGQVILLSSALIASFAVFPARAQQIWSGLTYTFEKPAFANSALPENQDRITDAVWITRGATEGLINVIVERDEGSCLYTHNVSPSGTEWATDLMGDNDGLDVEAANWEQLTFADWETAYGAINKLADDIVGASSVIYLIDENIYIDIEFTSWGRAFGGSGFSYMRGVDPSIETTGDYNGNGTVDAADYTV